MGIADWLRRQFRDDRATRHAAPEIIANYWGAGVPQPRIIKDISITGAYFFDADQWPVGTIMSGILRKRIETRDDESGILRVSFLVVRHGPDGMGVQFIAPTKTERATLKGFLNGYV